MFDARVDVGGGDGGGGETTHVGWREIDRRMRKIARRRAALDAEEAALLIAAKRAEVHKQLGYGSFAEYLGRVCGYAPGTVRERMRVAEALEGLPATREALEAGMITYSTVRELTRFVERETEEDWIVAVEGCTAREVEELARGREVGDLPDDRPHADLEPRRLRLELLPPDYALFLDARRHVERITGEHITDAEFMRVACRAVLGGGAATDAAAGRGARSCADEDADADDDAGDSNGGAGDDAGDCNRGGGGAGDDAGDCNRGGGGAGDDAGDCNRGGGGAGGGRGNVPPHQIAVTVCAECKRGWHETGGQSLELSPAHVERMRCDAVELGRVDGESVAERVRSIPAPIRRAVLARDRHRCTVPGCTSALFVDVHHIQLWSHGGDHTMSNLTTLCTLHHDLAHHGRIVISGPAGALVVRHADGRPYGTPPATPHASRASAASDSAPTTPHVGRAAAGSDSAAMTPHVGRATAAHAASGGAPRSAPVDQGNASSTSAARDERAPISAGLVEEARMALTGLGFRPAEASAAVAEATLQISASATLEHLVRAALVACRRYVRT